MSLADDIRAAIIWDPEALRRSDNSASKRFYEAMHLRMFASDKDEHSESDHPLSLIARGLALEYSNREEDAAVQYRKVATTGHSTEARIIGFAFLGWIGSGDLEALQNGLELARTLPSADRALRRSVFCKLLSIALDVAQLDLASRCLDLAMEESPSPSRIRFNLSTVGHTVFGREFVLTDDFSAGDGLGAEGHIESLITRVATDALEKSFLASIRSPWTRVISFGSGGSNDMSAAELQTTWMGAAWLVPWVRQQLGLQLLAGAAQTTRDFELGLAYWFLGDGGDPLEVGRVAEAHLDSTSCETILVRHMRRGRRGGQHDQFVKAASSLWSLLSPELMDELLTSITPSDRPGEVGSAGRLLWATGALIAPERWRHAYEELSNDERANLLPAISEGIAERLPKDVGSSLFLLCLEMRDAKPQDRLSIDQLILTLHRLVPLERPLPAGFVESLDDVTLTWLALRDRHLISDQGLRSRINRAIPNLQGILAAGRQGTESMFLNSPFQILGSLASLLPERTPEVEDLLLATALDREEPTNYLLGALAGLIAYVEDHSLGAGEAERLRQTPPSLRNIFLEPAPEELFRVRQLNVLFRLGDTSDRWELVQLVRHSDGQVRLEALAALDALGSASEDVRGLVMSGALFDPLPEVRRRALQYACERPTQFTALMPLVTRRLMDMFDTGAAEERAAAVRGIGSLLSKAVEVPELELVTSAARRDRSWLVRDAVTTGS